MLPFLDGGIENSVSVYNSTSSYARRKQSFSVSFPAPSSPCFLFALHPCHAARANAQYVCRGVTCGSGNAVL